MQLLPHTDERTEAMRWFLAGKKPASNADGPNTRSHAAHNGKFNGSGKGRATDESDKRSGVPSGKRYPQQVSHCRDRRQEPERLDHCGMWNREHECRVAPGNRGGTHRSGISRSVQYGAT